jgi:hypothetical protein
MQDLAPYISLRENGILMTIKVVPGSSRTEIVGCQGKMLKVKIAAPPEKGKANKALTNFLAETFNLKKADVEIISGHTASIKQVFLAGACIETVNRIAK